MIFNIPRQSNFIESLQELLLTKFGKEISNLKIFLPNHRSCQALTDLFASKFSGEFSKELLGQGLPEFYEEKFAIAMPKIKAIADLNLNDFADFLPNFKVEEFLTSASKIRVLNEMEAVFFIACEVQKLKIFGQLNFERAYKIALNLKEFCDDFENSAIEPESLNLIDDSNLAAHRQIGLDFLKNFFVKIRYGLQLQDLMFPAQYRNFLAENFSKFLSEFGSEKPIFIAGSTGSLPATKKIMRAILNQKNCAEKSFGIVIHGFEHERVKTRHKYQPQFLLLDLLEFLQVKPSQIQNFSPTKIFDLQRSEQNQQNFDIQNLKEQLISQIFIAHEDVWKSENFEQRLTKISSKELGIEMLVAKHELDEARKIADLIQENSDKANKIAVLCNNNLVKDFLILELKKRNISYNNAASCQLKADPLLNFLVLLFSISFEGFNPVAFLAFLKSEFVVFPNKSSLIANIEIGLMRKELGKISLEQFIKNISLLPNAKLKGLGANNFKSEIEFLLQIKASLPRDKSLDSLISSLESFCGKKIYEILGLHKAGEEIWKFFNQLKICKYQPNSSKELDFMLSQISFFEKSDENSTDFRQANQIDILSSIEFRLLRYNFLVVSGLNESNFPIIVNDGWLGSWFKRELGIDKALIRKGQNAFDFCNFLSSAKVFLSFSRQCEGLNSLPSSFIIKLETLFKKFGVEISYYKNPEKNDFEAIQNLSDSKKTNFVQNLKNIYPNPKPVSAARPRYFSITEISDLIANPYSIYVKKILRLFSLNEIGYQPANREFGNLVHKILQLFVEKNSAKKPLNDLPLFAELFAEFDQENRDSKQDFSDFEIIKILAELDFSNLFSQFFCTPESQLVWLPKFYKLFEDFLKLNQGYLKSSSVVEFPVKTAIKFLLDGHEETVLLSGIIDRIIFNQENSQFSIIDYKTGKAPSKNEVICGSEPQLTIAALMFEDESNIKNLLQKTFPKALENQQRIIDGKSLGFDIAAIGYWQLSRNNDSKINFIIDDWQNLKLAASEAKKGLANLFAHFLREENGFFATSKIKGNRQKNSQLSYGANPLWKLSREEEFFG